MEAESRRRKLWEALGQVLGYRELFLEDYPQASVQGVGILYLEPRDDLIEHAITRLASRLGIDFRIFRLPQP